MVTLGLSVLLALLTQLLKHFSWGKYVNPLIIALVISVAGGIVYAILVGTGWWATVEQHSSVVLAGSVTIYAIVREAFKMLGVDVKPLSQGDDGEDAGNPVPPAAPTN